MDCDAISSFCITTDRPSDNSDKSSSNPHLRGSFTVANLDLYLKRHPGYLFVVFQDYDCNCNFGKEPIKPGKLKSARNSEQRVPKPEESIAICSEKLCDQLNTLVKDIPDTKSRFPKFAPYHHDDSEDVEAPYFFYYHNREFSSRTRENLSSNDSLGLLLDYISQSVADTYKEVDDLLSQNQNTADMIPYLFAPTSIIVQYLKDDIYAYVQKGECRTSSEKNKYHQIITLPVESWSYNGKFTQYTTNLVVNFHIDHIDSFDSDSGSPKTPPIMKIQDLSAYPLRFAPENVRPELLERGKKFWRCRKQKFVLYTGLDYARTQYFVSNVRYETKDSKLMN